MRRPTSAVATEARETGERENKRETNLDAREWLVANRLESSDGRER
jgi:hypothetical protein